MYYVTKAIYGDRSTGWILSDWESESLELFAANKRHAKRFMSREKAKAFKKHWLENYGGFFPKPKVVVVKVDAIKR